MRATVEGQVVGKEIKEARNENQKTKYRVAINQGGLENAIVDCKPDTFNKAKAGDQIKLAVDVTAWQYDKSYGLSVKEA